jgi:hypothetical protein
MISHDRYNCTAHSSTFADLSEANFDKSLGVKALASAIFKKKPSQASAAYGKDPVVS